MKPIVALIDLTTLVVVILSVWSLRFLGIPFVGAITMAIGLSVVFGLLRMRGQSPAVIGLGAVPPFRTLIIEAARLLPWFGLAWVLGGLVGVALFGQPQASSAVTQLPDNFWGLLFDVTIITWVLIGFGEEVVFRGFILHRLLVLAGETGRGQIIACGIQALLFGALHASQGGAGMIMTGLIGFTFAWFYLSRPDRSLWPLILVHALTDTIILSASRIFG